MTHRHKGQAMEIEKNKNNYVSTMRMSQEENRISLLMSHSKQIPQ